MSTYFLLLTLQSYVISSKIYTRIQIPLGKEVILESNLIN